MRTYITAIESDLGAGIPGQKEGVNTLCAKALRSGLFKDFTKFTSPRLTRLTEPKPKTKSKHIASIASLLRCITKHVALSADPGVFSLFLTGDHSSAAGIVAGLKQAYPNSRLGLVWIDAHADIHTPQSSPSGNMHGMPLAIALGLQNAKPCDTKIKPISRQEDNLWQNLLTLGGKGPNVDALDLIYIGLRSFEPAEQQHMLRYNIPHITSQQLRQIGIQAALYQINKQLSACDKWFVSFDIDALDQKYVPGTGTPEPKGISKNEAIALNNALVKDARTIAWELTEFNPTFDKNNITLDFAFECLRNTFEACLNK